MGRTECWAGNTTEPEDEFQVGSIESARCCANGSMVEIAADSSMCLFACSDMAFSLIQPAPTCLTSGDSGDCCMGRGKAPEGSESSRREAAECKHILDK